MHNTIKSRTGKGLITLACALVLSGVSIMDAFAASGGEIVTAIEKSKILSQGTRVSAAVNGADVFISTYKNAKANDNDCKIEAVLMAKTAMDLAPDQFGRVNVYFYSAFNLNKRKIVSVTAGDVKAFGSGQLSKDQLLSSLGIKDEEVNDPANRLSAYLQQREGARTRKKIESYMTGDTLEVIADFDQDMNERDMKYEALKIAEKTLDTAGAAAKKVKVSFADPVARGNFRQITLDLSQIKSLDSSVSNALMGVQVQAVTNKVDVQSLSAQDGALKDERDSLLQRLKALDKNGVGIGPFLKQFFDIEAMVAQGNDDQAKATAQKLSASLTEQEDRTKTAKEAKPTKAAAPVVENPSTDKPSGKKPNRWATGVAVMDPRDILLDPDKAIKAQEDAFGGKDIADRTPRFANALKLVVDTLQQNGRTQEAVKFQQRLTEMQSRMGRH